MSSLKSAKSYWRRSSVDRPDSDSERYLKQEFLKGAAFLDDAVSRRQFLKIMGASAALMGAGCTIRKPSQVIRPFAKAPEHGVPGESLYYATTYCLGEDVVGTLASVSEGRPTKLEGNPLHPGSGGKSGVYQQASVLSLYDPDRLKVGRRLLSDGSNSSLSRDESLDFLRAVFSKYERTRGRGLSLLMETTMSPTVIRLISDMKTRLPFMTVYRYDPLNDDNLRSALFSVSGRRVVPQYDYREADVVVSFEHDFLAQSANSLVSSKLFADRRDPESSAMNRLYVFESNYSLTGAQADHRFRVWSSQIPIVLLQLVRALVSQGVSSLSGSVNNLYDTLKSPFVVPQSVVDEMAKDLIRAKGRAIVSAGQMQPPVVHELVYLINQSLGNHKGSISYLEHPFSDFQSTHLSSVDAIASLVRDVNSDKVSTLLVLGGDPIFNAPGDSGFREAFASIEETICFSMNETQTASASSVVIPRNHFLESWGDATSLESVSSLVQPVINPLYEGLSDVQFLSALLGYTRSDYAEVRRTWLLRFGRGAVANSWKEWLHNGVISNRPKVVSIPVYRFVGSRLKILSDILQFAFSTKGLELSFFQDASLYDGRFSNNGWLQELPDPITKLTWDNALLMSPKTAKKNHLSSSDMVKVVKGDYSLEVPVFVLPGHVDNALSLSLGYGQGFGRVGSGVGADAYQLRTKSDFNNRSSVSIVKLNRSYSLASTQEHGSMEGRPLYRESTIEGYKKNPDFASEMVETPPLKSLYPDISYDKGYQWGMTIDLTRCNGCNVCVVACQSENNIPIVGKREVANGREMHWIRVDRYFEGDEDNANIVRQPVTCMHCENAPCEQVCPVAATVHDEEGLNTMVYNRCVGTRYCSDNCPVKVRRFNFFDYHQRNPQSQPKERNHLFDYMKTPDPMVQRQFNPDVTVRMRGVMEKCTFCIQRINQGKIQAKNNNVTVKDGDIKTACQQACPTSAIEFGNILDDKSRVYKKRQQKRSFQLLEQLHLKARTLYLAAITNPNPNIVALLSKGVQS